MWFREEKEYNLSLLRWEKEMANMVLISMKPSPSLLPRCPQTHENEEPTLLCSLNTLGTYLLLSPPHTPSLSIKGHEMRNFSKVSLQKRGLASSPVYICGRESSKRDSLSAAQESRASHGPQARLSGTRWLEPHQYCLVPQR